MICKRDYQLAATERLLDRTRNSDPEIAVIAADPMRAVAAAADLRRAGIATLTQLSGSVKAQTKRAIAAEVEFLVFADDQPIIRCRRTRIEQASTDEALAADVMACLLFDWTVSVDELMALGEI